MRLPENTANCASLEDSTKNGPFAAPRWLANAHVQTLGASLPFFVAKASELLLKEAKVETISVPLAEGGELRGEAWWQADQKRRRTVILLHGVGGSSESQYMIRTAIALFRRGMHVVRLNMRGAGASVVSAPSLYHAGLTEDPRVFAESLTRDKRVDGIALVGFSLGGNVLLKLAGEWGMLPPSSVRAICTLSAPLDLDLASRNLELLRNLPYRVYVLRALVKQGETFAELHPERARYEPRALRRLTSIREYDRRVICPMHGFASVADYYGRASAGPYIHAITVPTLLLHAKDDPMVPPSTLSALEDASPSMQVAMTEHGGHVGWFGGLSEKTWLEGWVTEKVCSFVQT